MQKGGIRNGGMGLELAIELSLVGMKVLNHPKIITYIIYLKQYLKNIDQMCTMLPSNRKI